MNDQVTRTRVCTLELQNGVRVGVDLVAVDTFHETRCRPPLTVRIRHELRTCGDQPVIPDAHDSRIATVVGGREPIRGMIVEPEFSFGKLLE